MLLAPRSSKLLWLMLTAGCGPTNDMPLVAFGQGTQVGTWAVSAAGTAATLPRTAASPTPTPSATIPSTTLPTGAAGSGSALMQSAVTNVAPTAVAGSVAVRPVGAAGAAPPAIAAAGSSAVVPALPVAGGTSAAGSGGSAGSVAASGGPVSSLTFDVTTEPVGGRYRPKNVGAIWIEDSSGNLVKSLKVWAGIRRIWLTRYGSVLGFGGVDVMASATLSSHKAHHVTWDMKNVDGMAAPPGKYTLMMEVTDSDAPGRTNMIPFDTSAGAQMIMPPNAPSFTMMSLQLQ